MTSWRKAGGALCLSCKNLTPSPYRKHEKICTAYARHTFFVLLLFFMCDSGVKRESILSWWMHTTVCAKHIRLWKIMQVRIQWGALWSWLWHIHTYFPIAHEKAKGQHDTRKKAKYINGKLNWSSFWTKPPTLSPASWRSPTAILACGSSPRGAPRSASSTYSCRLPSRCTALPATAAPASANHLVDRLPCSLHPPHQTSTDLQGPLHIICVCIYLYTSQNIIISLMSQCAQAASICDDNQIRSWEEQTWQLNPYWYKVLWTG